MAPPIYVDKHGKPVKLSLLDAFVGRGPVLERNRKGELRYVVERKKKLDSIPEADAASSTATAPSPAAEPAAVTQPPVNTDPPPPASVAETASSLDTLSISSDAQAWSAVQDGTLIGMKLQNHTWNEISAAIPDKTIGDMKARWKKLDGDLKRREKGKAKAKDAGDNAKGGEGSSTKKHNKKDKEQEKKKKEPKKPDLVKKTGVNYEYPSDSDSDGSFIDPGDVPLTRTPRLPEKKIVKMIEVDSDEEEPIEVKGRPIVYMQPEDGLDEEEMQHLMQLTKHTDGVKWLEVASRFCDKTGKRLDPELLKAMFSNI
ncbi:hypothetical protein ACLMJK_004259 [Lecanora helva]